MRSMFDHPERHRRHRRRQERFRPPQPRTPALVGSSRTPLPSVPPRCSPSKPCLAEHHRQDATAEKSGEGPGCNLFFSLEGVFASLPEYRSEL